MPCSTSVPRFCSTSFRAPRVRTLFRDAPRRACCRGRPPWRTSRAPWSNIPPRPSSILISSSDDTSRAGVLRAMPSIQISFISERPCPPLDNTMHPIQADGVPRGSLFLPGAIAALLPRGVRSPAPASRGFLRGGVPRVYFLECRRPKARPRKSSSRATRGPSRCRRRSDCSWTFSRMIGRRFFARWSSESRGPLRATGGSDILTFPRSVCSRPWRRGVAVTFLGTVLFKAFLFFFE